MVGKILLNELPDKMDNMVQTSLMLERDKSIITPKTQGIKYTGSKLKLLPQILTLIGKTNSKVIFDGFSGTTRVSQALAQNGYQVIANDISDWSKVFGQCFLLNTFDKNHYLPILAELNKLEGKKGWFTHNYGTLAKKPWQLHNLQKLDAIREEIDRLTKTKTISEIENSVLLTSLMLAMDEVDNTIGHYCSYLKEWSSRSYKKMVLKVPQIQPNKENFHQVIQEDIFKAINQIDEVDLAYLDPPYGSNNQKMPASRVRYSAYYHLWKTISLNDKPKIFGKAGRRVDSSDTTTPSVFEDFRINESGKSKAIEGIQKLIKKIPAKYVLLSYSSGGKATFNELSEMLSNSGKLVEITKVDFKQNIMSSMKWTNKWVNLSQDKHQEFLFLLQK